MVARCTHGTSLSVINQYPVVTEHSFNSELQTMHHLDEGEAQALACKTAAAFKSRAKKTHRCQV